ncbi:hypothetical protein CBM2598_U20031 [Cupriavidus taiwanensis]|nr:hypothetical protein CBM2598_U20031 [Cupriavidus taiwanensis]
MPAWGPPARGGSSMCCRQKLAAGSPRRRERYDAVKPPAGGFFMGGAFADNCCFRHGGQSNLAEARASPHAGAPPGTAPTQLSDSYLVPYGASLGTCVSYGRDDYCTDIQYTG